MDNSWIDGLCDRFGAAKFDDGRGLSFDKGWILSGVYFEALKSDLRIWRMRIMSTFYGGDIALSFSEVLLTLPKDEQQEKGSLAASVLIEESTKTESELWKEILLNAPYAGLEIMAGIHKGVRYGDLDVVNYRNIISDRYHEVISFPWWIDSTKIISLYEDDSNKAKSILNERSGYFKKRFVKNTGE